MTRVLAGCPIRNRAWAVDAHVSALEANGVKDYLYICGDSRDFTNQVLGRRLLTGAEKSFSLVSRPDDPGAGWDRIEPRYSMPNIAAARNVLVEGFLRTDATHLWSVDSDIFPEPGCLDKLLEVDRPVVAALVKNGPGDAWNFMAGSKNEEPVRSSTEPWLVKNGKPVPVKWVGGCVLFQRRVFEEWGARYGPDERAEEFAIFRTLLDLGSPVRPWIHPSAGTVHQMITPELRH